MKLEGPHVFVPCKIPLFEEEHINTISLLAFLTLRASQNLMRRTSTVELQQPAFKSPSSRLEPF
ncbi:hypothetical protein F2Q70_00025001 [Brassica cretica]|uniref:Uncharacterized protein n=1 Tax=Brassica cretica TaxID=69181 RepID=A0A8S9L585_BRACR|nr:hypothetical protein F2Q70_00025001 [Brassica cretica]